MALYTERVQTVLTADQYEKLTRLAAERNMPISVLIREAIEKAYFDEIDRRRRESALERLLKLNAPVSDWPQMEAEIEAGAGGE